MSPLDIIDKAREYAHPGLAGSLLALSFMRGIGWGRRAALLIGGFLASHFLSGPIAGWLNRGDDEGAIGFVVGLFSMAVVAKLFDVIESIQPADLIERGLARIGLGRQRPTTNGGDQ